MKRDAILNEIKDLRSALRASSSGDLVVLPTRRRTATGLSLSAHREHGTRCRPSWSDCGRPPAFVVNWKHFCSSLSTDTGKQTDDCFVMRPRSPCRRRNTNDYVTHRCKNNVFYVFYSVTFLRFLNFFLYSERFCGTNVTQNGILIIFLSQTRTRLLLSCSSQLYWCRCTVVLLGK